MLAVLIVSSGETTLYQARSGRTPTSLPSHLQPRGTARAPRTAARAVPAAALLLASLLAGCGGGGGSDAGSPVVAPTALSITSANRDDVARTTVAALTGLSLTDAVNIALPSSAARARALTLGTAWLPSQVMATVQAAVLSPQQRALSAAANGQARALAVVGPFTDTCAAGGTVVSTLNDADNTATLTAGDSMTLVYNGCRMDADLSASVSGQFEVRYVSVTQGSTPAVVATITFTNFATTEGSDLFTLNGRMRMDYTQRSAVRQDITLSTETDVVAQSRVAGRSDTVTLQAGFSTLSVVETDVIPPEGGIPGRASVTTQGTVASTALAGSVVLSTPAPLVAYDVDDYPRSGNILVTGRSSSLRMTAVSATQVRLDLDSNGDGTVDSSSTVPWSSLE